MRVLAEYLDGELQKPADRELEHHLAICRSCYSRAAFERQLKAQLAELGAEPVPPKLKARVQALMKRFAVAKAD